ncbi:MAG: dihydrofolate reductase family protein, partial [Planctomycetota bacterium]
MMFPADTPAPDAISRILDAPDDRPFVVGQLGQSLDGRIATPTGESRWINGQVALTHLHAVRAAVDAVVVGVGTVIADDPQLNVRLVAMPEGGLQPARVILDPKGRTPAGARLFDAATGGPAIQVVDDVVGRSMSMTDTPPAQHILLPTVTELFGPRDVINALFQRGYRRILIEGGAHTVSAFID